MENNKKPTQISTKEQSKKSTYRSIQLSNNEKLPKYTDIICKNATDKSKYNTGDMPTSKPTPGTLSDKELYVLCKNWGTQALSARRKFAGLLPEVNKRELAARIKGKSWFERRGYICIYDFAARLAGIRKYQVENVLRLFNKFEDLPILQKALIDGVISHNKLARIAAIATAENQKELHEMVTKLSKRALDIYVNDYKKKNYIPDGQVKFYNPETKTPNLFDEKIDGGLMPKNDKIALSGQTNNPELTLLQANLKTGNNPNNTPLIKIGIDILNLDEDVKNALYELKIKGIDINDLLRTFLQERNEEIDLEIEEIGKKIIGEKLNTNRKVDQTGNNKAETGTYKEADKDTHKKAEKSDQKPHADGQKSKKKNIQIPTGFSNKTSARSHITIKIKNILYRKYGTKCATQDCKNPAQVIHHQKPYAIHKTHDPRFLKPLCKAHHELAHIHDQQYQKFRKTGTAKEGYRVSTFP